MAMQQVAVSEQGGGRTLVDMMCKTRIERFLLGITFALATVTPGMGQSSESRGSDGCEKNEPTAQASRLIDLELAAEQRAEALRGQLFDLEMRELDLQTRVDDLDYELTPDRIARALAFVTSVRPMDELRDAWRVRLESEKARLNKQLELLESRRERLEAAIRETEAEVERLRQIPRSR